MSIAKLVLPVAVGPIITNKGDFFNKFLIIYLLEKNDNFFNLLN